MLRTSLDKMKDNGFKLVEERSRRYPAQTIMDADDTNGNVILANTSAKVKTLLHTLERTAAVICLHVNADYTEYMCFNKKR